MIHKMTSPVICIFIDINMDKLLIGSRSDTLD